MAPLYHVIGVRPGGDRVCLSDYETRWRARKTVARLREQLGGYVKFFLRRYGESGQHYAHISRRLYAYILSHVETHGYQPCVDEMAAHLRVTPKTVRRVLDHLEAEDRVSRTCGHGKRALELVGVRFKRVTEGG